MKIKISIENQDWLVFKGDTDSLRALGTLLIEAANGEFVGRDEGLVLDMKSGDLGLTHDAEVSFGFTVIRAKQ